MIFKLRLLVDSAKDGTDDPVGAGNVDEAGRRVCATPHFGKATLDHIHATQLLGQSQWETEKGHQLWNVSLQSLHHGRIDASKMEPAESGSSPCRLVVLVMVNRLCVSFHPLVNPLQDVSHLVHSAVPVPHLQKDHWQDSLDPLVSVRHNRLQIASSQGALI